MYRKRKGIILAGGSGTRLYPITEVTCKQLLPVYDKPMIYYPLSILMLAGIQDILIISTASDLPKFQKLFGNGSNIGVNLSYKVQETPNGIAQAFILGKEFIGNDNVCLVLGDNILYGADLGKILKDISNSAYPTIFGYQVSDPERYGIVSFDKNGKIKFIEEKPKNPKSNYAVIGLYFYPNDVIEIAKTLKPSNRNEYEITDINNEYLKRNILNVKLLGRGYSWLDTGTCNTLCDATNFIRVISERQYLNVGCIEEIAWKQKWINEEHIKNIIQKYKNSEYGKYLSRIIK